MKPWLWLCLLLLHQALQNGEFSNSSPAASAPIACARAPSLAGGVLSALPLRLRALLPAVPARWQVLQHPAIYVFLKNSPPPSGPLDRTSPPEDPQCIWGGGRDRVATLFCQSKRNTAGILVSRYLNESASFKSEWDSMSNGVALLPHAPFKNLENLGTFFFFLISHVVTPALCSAGRLGYAPGFSKIK